MQSTSCKIKDWNQFRSQVMTSTRSRLLWLWLVKRVHQGVEDCDLAMDTCDCKIIDIHDHTFCTRRCSMGYTARALRPKDHHHSSTCALDNPTLFDTTTASPQYRAARKENNSFPPPALSILTSNRDNTARV